MKNKPAEMIYKRLESGFTPDSETLQFLRTSFGVNDEHDLIAFLKDTSLNDGTIYDLVIYPDEKFRIEIEKILSSEGLTEPEIRAISEKIISTNPDIFIATPDEKFRIEGSDKHPCIISFVKKLNLEISLNYLGDKEEGFSENLYYRMKTLLRRRKFSPVGDRGALMKRLLRPDPVIKTTDDEIINLADNAISFLSGREEKVFDALAVKKYYYESVISQIEEFTSLLKIWGMEYLMMKRIQPPPVSFDEAVKMIRTIDRITSIAYGHIIPPSDMAVQVRINSSDPVSDIFI